MGLKPYHDVYYNMTTSTLYFVRSGYIGLPAITGTLTTSGRDANYWSSTISVKYSDAKAVPSAYRMVFNRREVYPSLGPGQRYYGFSLR